MIEFERRLREHCAQSLPDLNKMAVNAAKMAANERSDARIVQMKFDMIDIYFPF